MGSGVSKQQEKENNTEDNPKAPGDKNRRNKHSREYFLKGARGTDYDFYGAHGNDKSRSVEITNFDGDISKLERYFLQKYSSDFRQANYDWDVVIVEFKSRQVAESVVKGVHKVEGTTLKITLDSKHMTKGGTVRKEQAIDAGTKKDGHLYPFGEMHQIKMASEEGWKTRLLMGWEVMEELLLEIIKATAKSVILEVEEEWRLGLTVPDEYDNQNSYEILASSPTVQSMDLPAGCNLSIPPGATEEDTSVISAVLNPHGYEGTLQLEDDELLVTDIIEMRPAGMTFSKPLKLKIPHSLPKFHKERDYFVMTSEDNGRSWKRLKTLSASQQGYRHVTVEVTHLSAFAVGARLLERCHEVKEGQDSTLKSSEQTGVEVSLPKGCVKGDKKISLKVTPVDRDTITCARMKDSVRLSGIDGMSHIIKFVRGSQMLLNRPATIVLPLSPCKEDSQVRVLSCNENGDWEDVTNRVEDIIHHGSNVTFKTNRLSDFTVVSCKRGTDASQAMEVVTKHVRAKCVRTIIFKKWKEPREDGIMTARMECVLEESVEDRICATVTNEKFELQEGTPTPPVVLVENETICAIFQGNLRPDVEMVNGMYGVNFKFFCERTDRREFNLKLVDKEEAAYSVVDIYPGPRERYYICRPGKTPATPLATAEITAPKGIICDYWLACQRFKNTMGIADTYLSPDHNMCFCETCHTGRGESATYTRGNPEKKYAVPVGWGRFGLIPNKVSEDKEVNVFTNWHRAYHGTVPDVIKKILQTSQLLMPGDIAMGGGRVREQEGHFNDKRKPDGFDTKQVYLSPSILYSGNDVYAYPTWFKDPHDGKQYKARVVFQVCVRPNSYKVGPETIGARREGRTVDPLFSNNELEWFTKERGGHVLYGLLVKLEGQITKLDAQVTFGM